MTRSPPRPSAWWLVLGLVGLDYFSTLAYLPSIIIEAAGPLAPLAALFMVLVTLFLALPVYLYVVGHSPDGQGATGLLERALPGWGGKLVMLVLMGFVAADFVITRSLSVADASIHVLANPRWDQAVDRYMAADEQVALLMGPKVWKLAEPFWTRQMAVTIALALVAFALLWLLHRGFTRNVLRLAALVTLAFLAISGVVVGSGVAHLIDHPVLLSQWWARVLEHGGVLRRSGPDHSLVWRLLALVVWAFPQMALAISGFELSMTVAPLIDGGSGVGPHHVRRRIRNARKLMLVAALVMAVYVTASVTVCTLLLPENAFGDGGAAEHRALAYLAHGGELADGRSSTVLGSWFGGKFGTLYDTSAVLILCLAGASSLVALRDSVPTFLHRAGMELEWAHRHGLLVHLFNAIILVVTVVFHASVSAQQWAYATSVLALLAGASLAALVDLSRRWRASRWRPIVSGPFALCVAFFVTMELVTLLQNRSGLVIALCFVASILASSSFSRWMRSTELRFRGFSFADDATRRRWQEIVAMEFQVLVPHRPGQFSLAEKNADVRRKHRLGEGTYLVFIEVFLGDPSDFQHQPLMRIEHEGGLEVIRVARAVSVSHVIAAIGLEFSRVGTPPEIIFGWSHEAPLAANLNFLLWGEGNVPWMVQHLVRRAQPEPARRPRIVVG
ncbi:MAG TPA: hypothetical protein VJ783_13350 [Pirellulales bacterium]|nr:hypothetical protein [Pirellulales bacterium]